MPHFVVECSSSLFERVEAESLLSAVFETAVGSGLFEERNIKVRLRPYQLHLQGAEGTDFLHVFAHIMGGRTTEQKKVLSVALTRRLKEMLPGVSVVSVNVYEFDPETYSNRDMV